jgi:3-dehydroquinate dehydratase/shikimate dehydrogenase
MTYLAVPIAAETLEQARVQIESAVGQGAEMLELRLDYMDGLDVEKASAAVVQAKSIAGKSVRVIATARDVRQGGAKDYPLSLRVDVLAAVLKAGADFIDYEYENCVSPYRDRIQKAVSASLKGRLIVSAHNFAGRFDNLAMLYRHIATAFPAAVPKLVYKANHINDCFEAFDLLRRTGGDRIILCMGEAGVISRILAKKVGSFVTFAALNEDSATAPGQLTLKHFRELYRYQSIKTDTELYGVVGWPIGHSLSPAVHNGCFAKGGENKLYVPLAVEGGYAEFAAFVHNIISRSWLGFRGLSVTIPHKVSALNFIKERGGNIEPLALRIGAVNTILISKEGKVSGYNTDCAGAVGAIMAGMGISSDELLSMGVAIVGAGGAARAIVAGLIDAGAQLTIYNRTVSKARELAEDFGCAFAGLDGLRDMDAKLLVNCTSVGMHPDVEATPVPPEYIKAGMIVFDTIYNPIQTRLLKEAKNAGAKTISGMEMFINQAAAQFKLFTGKDADINFIRKSLDAD